MYRQHQPRVLAYALRRVSLEHAQDAVADAFLVAWRRFDELPPEPLPWLIGTTRRTLANQRRSSGRRIRLVARLTDALSAQRGSEVGSDVAATVHEALSRLTIEDREALTLVAWDDLSPSQAAASLGCAPVVFRVRLHRARRRFEQAFAAVALSNAGGAASEEQPTVSLKEAR